jgi:molybdopterin molybdotransferase
MTTSWQQARDLAGDLAPLGAHEVVLSAAAGLVLAADVVARSDLPSFTASAMDGWAVCGEPPWTLKPGSTRLAARTATAIATGWAVPEGAEAVLRTEHAEVETGTGVIRLRPGTPRPVQGQDIRRQGTECRAGDVVAERGTRCVPAVLGLAAAAGVDSLTVVRRPIVDLLILGDELIDAGVGQDGRVRDALGPMLPPWLTALGAVVTTGRRVADSPDALAAAIAGSAADLLVTTGSTAKGPHDHLHDVLASLGAELLADGVDVRPGHPMLLARLPDGRRLAGLPGNPLAAVSGVLTLVAPGVHALAGLEIPRRSTAVLTDRVTGHPHDVRLIPIREGRPLHHIGPAMLRGLASADALAVIPPGGAGAGDEVEALPLP